MNLLPIAGPRATWSLLWSEIRKLPVLSIVAAIVITGGSAAGLVAPWALGVLVDDISGGADRSAIVQVVLLIGGAALLTGLLTALGVLLVARVGETVLARIREKVLDRVLQLPAPVLDKVRTGDLLSRVGDDVATVASALTDVGPMLLGAALTIILTVGGLFALDWRLGLAGLLAVPMYIWALRWYLPRSAPFYSQERVAMGERSEAIIASLRGSATVRAYQLEDVQLAKIDATSANARDLSIRVFRYFSFFTSRINHAEFTGLAGILVAGFFLVRADAVTIGAVTAAALYFHRLFNPIGAVLMLFDEVQTAAAGMARLAGVLEMEQITAPPPGAGPADASIELVGIGHAYDGPLVVDGVSLRLEPGERVALVGASGAGKTTLAALAAGVLTPTAGVVKLGGVDVQALGEDRTRAQVALLSQEVHVFSGTLAEDVRLARPEATDAAIEAALETVGALAWVRALPDGLETVVGEEGHQLTGAQSQQLAFARLVLADPPVAVLDEATAEAGSAGARELERASVAATAGRTTLIVAHRLTQAEQADRIVVLDHGRVVETGTHTALLASGGRYAQLWHSWTGFKPGEPGGRTTPANAST
ncbi:ABC transporter ATP-binding protein [Kribbella sandramycini]|uniref:ABC transporter ATP-binding protein n=1 Tax=Kribbella sandramycini TaxID=60450 RepID=A0A7Y4L705_9ACTN|nr:ABC transporter ATP-binding protein [Kribbella sandramycini]MBB6566746.1 ATP-binding cassette subfamily C protein [Kribbella sandramycini]NOL45532.1 ABC transporter ATP-binding protein [Kribbella sandramycini]